MPCPHCPHNRVIGDNYGKTCLDCGQVLEGYGYFANGSPVCRHLWFQDGDGFVCLYCEIRRPSRADGEADE